MKNINDELLNKYLDKELNPEEMDEVKAAIKNSVELKKKYEALLTADNLLKSIGTDIVPGDFSKKIINKIRNKKLLAQQQKYFLFTVLSFFGLLVLGITGYVFYEIISSVQVNESSEVITTYSKTVGDYFSSLFGKKNLSILGSVLSFIMLASGYFLYEYQKHSKKNFSH